jgi:hypothetical protein
LSRRFTTTTLGPIGAIGRSRGREGAFYLRLPLDLVVKNDRTSRRATNCPW